MKKWSFRWFGNGDVTGKVNIVFGHSVSKSIDDSIKAHKEKAKKEGRTYGQ